MDQIPHERFSRLDPETTGRHRQPKVVEPSSGHRLLEIGLTAGVIVLLALAGLALYTSFAPSFREVPNRFQEGVAADRLNLLLIGIGGDTHPGGGRELADAIMLVSLQPSTRRAAVISVPRDLYVDLGRYGEHRINRTHMIGNQTGYPGGGAKLLMDTVEQITGEQIHAYARIDFAAFREIIDSLGGVEIDVKQGFYDYLFRDRFQAGPQLMDGDRALRFARYRYVIGDEGTAFAREERQQQVLRAVRDRLRERADDDILQLIRTARSISRHTDTNLSVAQITWLARNFRRTSDDEIRYVTLEPYMEIFDLRSITDSGEAVRPRTGNYAEIRSLADSIFASSSSTRTASGPNGMSAVSPTVSSTISH